MSERPSPLSPIPRPVPLAQQAHDRIKRDLLSGAWEPGRRVTEEELAEQLSMSRTPVREALHRLSLAGLVAAAPGGGYVRRGMSRRDVLEHCELRLVLEPEAAALAASSAPDELRAAVGREASDGSPLGPERNLAFHAAVAAAAGSEVLAALIRSLNERAELHQVYEREEGVRERLGEEHRRVGEAILARDGGRARKAMVRHLETVRDLLLDESEAG